MILLEDGLLSLNVPVSRYIPEFVGEHKDTVMVHHLLTHTSGLRDDVLYRYADGIEDRLNLPPVEAGQHPRLHEYLHLRYSAPLLHSPGKEMSYCNFNYDLLGEKVRRASGEPLSDFTRKRIFEPLGMKDTGFEIKKSAETRVIRRELRNEYDEMVENSVGNPRGCSGAASTALDMAVFGQMFLNRGVYGNTRILSPASVIAMTRNQIPGVGASYHEEVFPEATWGYGWNVSGEKKYWDGGSLLSPSTFSHGGAGRVRLTVDPVSEVVFSLFYVYMQSSKERGFPPMLDILANIIAASIMEE